MLKEMPYFLVGLGALTIALLEGGSDPETTPPTGASVTQQVSPGQLPANPPVLGLTSEFAQPPASHPGDAALTWTVPDDWTVETPSSGMRRGQYGISGPGGPAEMVVYYFGPGQGGPALENAERWARQFRLADGTDPAKSMSVENRVINGLAVVLVAVQGTYAGGMTTSGPQDLNESDYRLLGAIAEGPDANWFFKLTGPTATVETQVVAFQEFVQSIRVRP